MEGPALGALSSFARVHERGRFVRSRSTPRQLDIYAMERRRAVVTRDDMASYLLRVAKQR